MYIIKSVFVVYCSGLGGNLDAAAISDFVDSGHDLILAADETTSDTIREIASDCGVDFDEVLQYIPSLYLKVEKYWYW